MVDALLSPKRPYGILIESWGDAYLVEGGVGTRRRVQVETSAILSQAAEFTEA